MSQSDFMQVHRFEIGPHSRWPMATATHDERFAFIASQNRITAIDSDDLCVAWNHEFQNGELPESSNRCIQLGLRYAPRLFPSLNLLVHLTLRPDGGVNVHALRPLSGEHVWNSSIPLPPPAEWTEPLPVVANTPTEDLFANLVCRADRVVAVLNRHSRRSEVWTADGHYPRPPFRGQIELIEFDAANGVLTRRTTIENAQVGFYEIERFDGLLRRGHEVFDFDWSSGRMRHLVSIDSQIASIASVQGRVYAAWHCGSRVGVVSFSRRPPIDASNHIFNAKQVKEVVLYAGGERALLRINQTRLIRLSEDGSAELELRIPPYLYDLVLTRGATLFVGCSGRGANLLAFSTNDGELVLHQKATGSLQLVALRDAGCVAAIMNKTLTVYDRNAAEIGTVPCIMVGRGWSAQTLAVCGNRIVQLVHPDGREGPEVARIIDINLQRRR